jgi:hypothetical protein
MNTDLVSIFESLESYVLYLVSIYKSLILCLFYFLKLVTFSNLGTWYFVSIPLNPGLSFLGSRISALASFPASYIYFPASYLVHDTLYKIPQIPYFSHLPTANCDWELKTENCQLLLISAAFPPFPTEFFPISAEF